ncbi:jg5782, partial [Pararge aegeria aegeria]
METTEKKFETNKCTHRRGTEQELRLKSCDNSLGPRRCVHLCACNVEKRKAFFCPLCSERVSYGVNFSAHLLHRHHVTEQVEQLEFGTMDDFMMYKSEIQEETKYRFRKTTASKQTIEGIRSHYM